jgi:hypothetical protein
MSALLATSHPSHPEEVLEVLEHVPIVALEEI